MYRALIHHWRVNLAVTLAAAVATAVLAGALLVGDSVRGSLRELTLDRLGRIDSALVSQRFFREELADDLAARPDFGAAFNAVAPAILIRGSATGIDVGTRASRVTILGIDARFAGFYDTPDGIELERGAGQVFASVIVNRSLQRELGVEVGDGVLLRFGRSSDIPRDTLMGEKDPDDVLGRLRAVVTRVLPDRGIGRFGLNPAQQAPLVALVDLKALGRALDRDGVNGLFVSERALGAREPDTLLPGTLRFEDLGLILRGADEHFVVESDEFVLRPVVADAIRAAADELGAPLLEIQSYLANEIRVGDRRIPYSMVVALDPLDEPWGSFTRENGKAPPPITDAGILLNTWAAKELGANPSDPLEMTYFTVGPREELREETTSFRVRAIVTLDGLAADRRLTPSYPGIEDAEDISAWDPPFPVDLDKIRPVDEAYWDDYGATPKAFVSRDVGRRLWSTRFGSTTSMWVGASPGRTLGETEADLRASLLERLSPDAFGFNFRAVKAEGLQAAAGATDFAMLFISFSFFLIVSAALLVGLLFSLNVERRAREIGLLLAVGYPVRRVMRQLMGEGLALASVGALFGLVGGVGYAWLMMAGLRTLWVGAVGSSALYLHVRPVSLVLGWTIAVLVILFSIYFAVRRLKRIAPPALLAGVFRQPARGRRGRLTPILAHGSTALALILAVVAMSTGQTESMGLAFGTGSLLLIAGLAYFALWCRRAGQRRGGWLLTAAVAGMAARNTSWSPGRSILSVALVASASFVIVAVGANRQQLGDELLQRDSGTGGFTLVAESDVPIHQDLSDAEGRFDLGFDAAGSAELEQIDIFALRDLPGEDASCLNLYQPEKPRVLGVPRELIERGGFRFAATLDLPDDETNPWAVLDRELEEGVIPAIGDAHSLQWILHKKLGEEILVEDEYGQPLRLLLVGSLDRSIFQSELLIPEDAFLRHFPSHGGFSYFLFDVGDAAEPRAISQLLEKTLEGFGFDATTTRDKLEGFLIVEHTYLSTFQMLGAFGLLLGTIGLGVVLIRNVIERRGELATLRAFGFRRSKLAWMVLAENAFLLLIGMTVGSLSALAAVAPRLAQIQVDWTSLAMTLGVVLLVGMLSSTVAVLGTLRVPLLPALKAE